jgi:hypothetical protein
MLSSVVRRYKQKIQMRAEMFGLARKISLSAAAARCWRPFVADFAPQTATLHSPDEK